MKFYTKRCSQNTQKLSQVAGSLLDFRMFLSFTRSVLFLLPLASLFLLASCGGGGGGGGSATNTLSIANSSANEGDASIYFRVTLRPASDSTVSFEYKTQRITANNDVDFTSQTVSIWHQYSHSSLVFDHNDNNDSSMWILGGHGKGDSELFGRVWAFSNDKWYLVTTNASWDARESHSSLVFNNKMWVLGGSAGDGLKNDVWSSTNGIDWTDAGASNHWSARQEHTSVVFDNKMWVLGGSGVGDSLKNDVWSSPNGRDWNEVKADSTNDPHSWSARQGHSSVVFKGKIWVLGGQVTYKLLTDASLRNDVWSSTNGITWTNAGASNHWSARQEHTSVVFEDKIWVLGGSAGDGLKRDAWSFVDGEFWYKANKTDLWGSALQSHSSVVFEDKMWVLGGINTEAQQGVYSAFNTGDYKSVSASGSIPPGATTTDIEIGIIDDSNREEVETFELIIINPTNAIINNSKATGTILDDD